MATAPTRPALKERFERRRAEVLNTCAEVFAERGYDGAGIEDLSAATGLAAGGLYHYIGSKEQALFEIFSQLMDPLLQQAREIEISEAPAAERLRSLLRLWVAHVAAHRHHMLVFSQERHILERDPGRWRQIRHSRRDFERLLASLLEQTAAEISPSREKPDLQLIELALLGMVNYAPQWLKPTGRLRAEQIADGYCSLVLAGLSAP